MLYLVNYENKAITTKPLSTQLGRYKGSERLKKRDFKFQLILLALTKY